MQQELLSDTVLDSVSARITNQVGLGTQQSESAKFIGFWNYEWGREEMKYVDFLNS